MYNIAKIFELLKERKLEQKDLAKRISISEGNFSSWKRGLTKPSDKVMQKIADYFGLPLSDFYVYDSTPPDKKASPNKVDEAVVAEILARMEAGTSNRGVLIAYGGKKQEIIELSDEQLEQVHIILDVMKEREKRQEEKNNQ